jgi:hypothetical protein
MHIDIYVRFESQKARDYLPAVAVAPKPKLRQTARKIALDARKETLSKSVVDYDEEEIEAFLDELYGDTEQVATEM